MLRALPSIRLTSLQILYTILSARSTTRSPRVCFTALGIPADARARAIYKQEWMIGGGMLDASIHEQKLLSNGPLAYGMRSPSIGSVC
ncbi:hypothetical protein DFH06DRAFT_1482462, partial [Mycena polygramma]